MGLVQNLKKILTESGKIILQGLLSHYIKQRAKQTSKKQDNFSSITYSQRDLTTEPQSTTIATSLTDTSEKIIMQTTTEDIVSHVREWSIDRASNKNVNREDARAILAEFYEWIEPEGEDLEIVSLEPED